MLALFQSYQTDIPLAEAPVKTLRQLLEEAGLDAAKVEEWMRKPLIDLLAEAKKKSWNFVVEKLLAHGVEDVNIRTAGLTDLRAAVEEGQRSTEMLIVLLLKGDDNKDGE